MDIARDVAAFLSAAESSLDLALYDVRLPSPVGDVVAGAVRAASERGVEVRIAFNEDNPSPIAVPPPPRTRPDLLAALGVPIKPIPGEPDLMHHKYVTRDRRSVLTGSTNWTEDSWSREENVMVTVESPEIAAAYARNFAELWDGGEVSGTGRHDPRPVEVGTALVRAWFCPGRGDELAQQIATVVGRAQRRVRIASPVLTSGPILGTLAEIAASGKVDVAGVLDATQITEVYGQWSANSGSRWKLALLDCVLDSSPFTGKRSTPYRPDAVHDYMHAKVTVADDVAFVGSFNLSHSGEQNAENVLEIIDSRLASEIAAYVDAVRARYPPAPRPGASPAGTRSASPPRRNPRADSPPRAAA
jgi:phosphatidylserine/phosphatidylglycerophosphate/cardiolipin synthase-like enzyme